MGIKCRIKKENNLIKEVLAPNGRSSILFNNLSNFIKNKNKALDVWTIAYTPQFKESFGDWERNSNDSLDENGEPFSEDVLIFTSNASIIKEPLTKRDIITLRNSLLNTNVNTIEELFNRLSNAFYINGIFNFSIENAKRSGIYTMDESNNLSSDNFNINTFESFLNKFRAYYLRNNGRNSDLDNVHLNESINPDLIVYRDSYNELGKREMENPYVVEQNIINTVGGIQDRAEFDNQFNNISYNALTERYQNDSSFGDRMYKAYSYLTRMPIMDSSNSSTPVSNQTLSIENNNPLIFDLSPEKVTVIRKKIDVLLQVPANIWTDKKSLVKSSLREIEEDAIEMNIDIIGLSNRYESKTQEQIENFLSSMDIFLSDAVRGEITSEFNDAYITFFDVSNEPHMTAIALPQRMRDNSLVYINNKYDSETSTFENDSLLKINDNVYHKIDNSIPLNELYDNLYSIATLNPDLLPRKMFYPAAFDKNGFSQEKLSRLENKSKVINSFKKYVASIMPYYPISPQVENMIVYKAIFGYNLLPNTPSIERDDFSNRYYNITGSSYSTLYVFPNQFRQYVLKEKLNNSDLYNNVLSKFRTNGMNISLYQNDYLSKQDIDMLLPKGKIRTELINYSLLSTDSAFDNLFSLRNKNYYPITREMNSALYASYPGLLEPFTGQISYIDGNPNQIRAKNVFDDYINIHDSSYEKIAQDGTDSIYSILPRTHNGFIVVNNESIKSAKTLDSYKQFEIKEGSFIKERKLYREADISQYQC